MGSIIKTFNRTLDSTTMYRVVEYALGAMAGYAVLLSFFGILPYNGFFLMLSLALLVSVAWSVNQVSSFFARIPAHPDSSVITALILFFLLAPIGTISDAMFLALGAAIAMLSKYIFAVKHRQIFNPAACAAVILGLLGGSVLWWVGSFAMLPAAVFAGYCILKKIRRFSLFFTAFGMGAGVSMVLGMMNGIHPFQSITQYLFSSPIIFFASVMVTEPLTTPPTHELRILYGAFVGVCSNIFFHIGPLYSTPELALVMGNIFSFVVSMHERLRLNLIEKKSIARDTVEFVFEQKHTLSFSPGQYLEWTLPHPHPDTRGIRRYFTIASSPTEKTLRIATKYSTPSSTFKKRIQSLVAGDSIWAAQLCGDFTLPYDAGKKLVFIAGGIGITPFRSMIRYCIDSKDTRDIVLFYQNKTPKDIAYTELFDEAHTAFGLRTVYLVSAPGETSWSGEVGYLNTAVLQKYLQDIYDRLWYLSGPSSMVNSYKKILLDMGVRRDVIFTDYFPGCA